MMMMMMMMMNRRRKKAKNELRGSDDYVRKEDKEETKE